MISIQKRSSMAYENGETLCRIIDNRRWRSSSDAAIPSPTRPFEGDAGESGARREEGEPQRKSSRMAQREVKTAR